jgi:hypothetical protein
LLPVSTTRSPFEVVEESVPIGPANFVGQISVLVCCQSFKQCLEI